MYLVAIAWLYVALMMAVAEATHPLGTVLGAIVTFLFYGLLPTAIIMYVMGTPLRRKAQLAQEAEEHAAAQASAQTAAHDALPTSAESSAVEPDAGGHAPGTAKAGRIPPV
jgi:Na+-transporting methylmalonyl-CoA/oxaloacetate decarboxylase gamma subunit